MMLKHTEKMAVRVRSLQAMVLISIHLETKHEKYLQTVEHMSSGPCDLKPLQFKTSLYFKTGHH